MMFVPQAGTAGLCMKNIGKASVISAPQPCILLADDDMLEEAKFNISPSEYKVFCVICVKLLKTLGGLTVQTIV